jgi:3-deoxy-D-manno-octulosonate cytidylyltransferase
MTYESTAATGLFDEVWVVTDSEIIYNEITGHGGKAMLSKREHVCGTDRIAEAALSLDADIILNVQGDEPFTSREPLEKLLAAFKGPEAAEIDAASLMQPLEWPDQIANPSFVKVVVDLRHFAMYFSRQAIPYRADPQAGVPYYKHIGVYAFRRQALLDFYHAAPTPLELAEKLEGNRYLEMGKKMKMVLAAYPGIQVDTPQDLKDANKYWNQMQQAS